MTRFSYKVVVIIHGYLRSVILREVFHLYFKSKKVTLDLGESKGNTL